MEPKISTIEAFLLICVGLIIDIVPAVLIFVGLPDFFIPGLLGFTTQFYFRMKGVSRAGLDLTMSAVELIPYVDALPWKTVGIAMVIWSDWHPESAVARATQKIAEKVPAKGKVSAPKATAPGVAIKTPVGGLAQQAVRPRLPEGNSAWGGESKGLAKANLANAPAGGFKQTA